MTREEIQQDSVELSTIHNNLVLELATGVGKSLAAIQIIEKHKGKWNIVIAETNHELNWIEEFKKHKKATLLKRVTFFCYQSLHKHTGGENYIFDEVHHLFSEKRLNLLSQIHLNNLKHFIGLSATITRKQRESLTEVLGRVHIHKITLSEAIDFGILPEPTVYFIGVKLGNTTKYLKYHFTKDKFVMCNEQEYYDKITARIEVLKKNYFATQQEFDKIKWLSLANSRKKFLAECKTKYARELVKQLGKKRFICFTGSIEQSEQLSNGRSIHSKIPKNKREKLIEDFNTGEISNLFATGMLKEGMNFNNIEAGIIIQLDNVERYFNQLHGRILRSEYPEQYVLYVKDTQDANYVTTVLENFNKDYVKFIEFEELIN